MNDIVQDKMQRQIMVIQNKILFSDIERKSWFIPVDGESFEKKLLENYEYMQRGIAETNFDYKQPIPYGVVRNIQNGKVFVYKRWWAGSNAWDSRLHSKFSIGVGGHIEQSDDVKQNLMVDCLLREIYEEISIKPEDVISVKLIWGINDDSNEVGKVHFWMCYIVDVGRDNFTLTDGELHSWEFMSFSQIKQMQLSGDYDVETWTSIIIPHIDPYL